MRLIAARLSARYSGRIEAELSLGDALLLIRDYESDGDGSVVLLDAAGGVQPRNWMPAGSSHEERLGGWIFRYPSRNEILEVFIEKVYVDQTFEANMITHLHKIGAETEMSDLLAKNIKVLDTLDELKDEFKDISFIDREFRTSAGPIDIMASDKYGLVVIELKRVGGRASVADLYQLQRYIDALRIEGIDKNLIDSLPKQRGRKPLTPRSPVRGLLIAPGATKQLNAKLDSEEMDWISFLRLSYKELVKLTNKD